MAKGLVSSGLVGGLLAISAFAAAAQDAQPAAVGCTGFMCKIFGSRLDDRSAPVAAAAPAAQSVAAIPDPSDPSDATRTPRKATAKPAAKPVPTVVIAADAAETSRFKALAATMPKNHLRIVAPGAVRVVDFAAIPTVDRAGSGEKARLFTEQLHIVAGAGVRTIADLKDKVVSFGPDKGPAQIAARKAFGALGVGVSETPLDLDNALDGLASGDIAALVVLAPQPDPRLARLKTGANLHLVPWPEAAPLPEGTEAARIPATAYPGLATAGDDIRAVGVVIALESAGRPATPAAKAFLVALSQHSEALSKRGFDLIKADLDGRASARVASAERR